MYSIYLVLWDIWGFWYITDPNRPLPTRDRIFNLGQWHRTVLLVFWPLKLAVSSDQSIPAWQGHKI